MRQTLGIVGNCSFSAVLSAGSVEWLCWPRPDSSFVFGPLLDRERGGRFLVEGIDTPEVRQEYLENTNVLRTVFSGEAGSFELLDFAPRFVQFDRSFKPSMLVRIMRLSPVTRAHGSPANRSTTTARPSPARGGRRITSSTRACRRRCG